MTSTALFIYCALRVGGEVWGVAWGGGGGGAGGRRRLCGLLQFINNRLSHTAALN